MRLSGVIASEPQRRGAPLRLASFVVPAKAGTHNHCRMIRKSAQRLSEKIMRK
jgi:hypothetical protein